MSNDNEPRRDVRRILTIGEQDEARRLWAKNMGTAEIADILRVPEPAVYNALAAERPTGDAR